MHVRSEPPILYFGTPVVLLTTTNPDGTPNIAPMSSAFWLGWRCMLGLGAGSQSAANLLRDPQCVINLPSAAEVDAVDRLALTTGADPVPAPKQRRGYRTVHDKFAQAGLTPQASEAVRAPRIAQCPVQMEAVIEARHGLADEDPLLRGHCWIFEARILRVHVAPALLAEGEPNRIDPDRWRPLIMSFQQFYGLQDGPLQRSTLARIPEASYRSPDVDRARAAPLQPMPA
ncbi:flavin reductase family protein [Aquincola sp. S2]|uniref:Flavin reductase family protein n=1 Tax=Pseudaquabacterium terrae TaxID=2732868 RepID=A0ABX2ELM1_9BURK|nr:flavin reductase family protein [Aquabacterium terrae]NRF69511.1 flavin reductase family protein [Aquabacterium terrae]